MAPKARRNQLRPELVKKDFKRLGGKQYLGLNEEGAFIRTGGGGGAWKCFVKTLTSDVAYCWKKNEQQFSNFTLYKK